MRLANFDFPDDESLNEIVCKRKVENTWLAQHNPLSKNLKQDNKRCEASMGNNTYLKICIDCSHTLIKPGKPVSLHILKTEYFIKVFIKPDRGQLKHVGLP